jgi:glycosyltransferase involved in cell wall biosynthesis
MADTTLSDAEVARNVVVLAETWAHQSSHAGYCGFVAHMPDAVALHYVMHGRTSLYSIPGPRGEVGRLRIRDREIPVRSAEALVRAVLGDRSWTPLEALIGELRVLSRMTYSRRRVYHLMYADEQYGLLGRIGWPRRCKVVGTFHQPSTELWKWFKNDHHLRRLDGAIIVASSQRDLFDELLGPDRVFLVPLGVDCEYWRPGPAITTSDGKRTVLCVGQWQRDFETMHAVARTLRRAWGDALTFVVITSREHADHVAQWDGVRVLVGVSETDLRNWYRSADLTLLPLLDGTANNALVESLACGTPVVATDVGAAHDLACTNAGVIAVPAREPEKMAETVLSIFEDGRLEELSHAARRQGESLDWRHVAHQLIDVYRTLMQCSRR